MPDKLGADHPLLVEVIESHQDRLRVMELVEAERDELRAEVERLRERERLLGAGPVTIIQRVALEDLWATNERQAEEIERLRKDVEELTLILDSHRTKPTDGSLSRWVCQT
jgi:hypothetical protein